MFSARLPSDLVERVAEAALEADEPRAELVERALEAELARLEAE
jgi:predicted transcriptional regulator